jgi:membrane associated rhomboid family serine protease
MDSLSIMRQTFRHHSGRSHPHLHRFIASKRVINAIIGINIGIYGLWTYADYTKDSKLQANLLQNATLSWANVRAKHYWTFVTSAFSHKDFLHIFFNMISFNAFASVLCVANGVGVGVPHICALTLSSAVAAGATWLYQKKPETRNRRRGIWGRWGEHGLAASVNALGASGVVMAFSAVATCLAPMQKFLIFPLPIPIPIFVLTCGYFAVDLFYLNVDDSVGRSAHLGGAVFGVVYYLAALRGYGGVAHMLTRRRF